MIITEDDIVDYEDSSLETLPELREMSTLRLDYAGQQNTPVRGIPACSCPGGFRVNKEP
jgi:hypothetical protein